MGTRILVAGHLLLLLSSAVAAPALAQDSLGIRRSAVPDEVPREAIAPGAAAGTRILLFNSACELCDAVADIGALGGLYTRTSDPDDLDLPNLKTFDIVWIGALAGFASWSSRCSDLDDYVQGGGSLVIGQPGEVGAVPCLPSDLRAEVTSIYWPGDEHQIIDDPGSCIVDGIKDAQLPGHADTVPIDLLGASWSIVTADRETPTEHAGMLYARHGAGQILFTDMCAGAGTPQVHCSIPAAPAFLDRLVGCLRQHGPQVVCDIQLNGTTFGTGDAVIAQVLRIANPTAAEIPIEVKIWFEGTTSTPVSFVNLGARGHLKIPPGFDTDVGPLPLFTVTSACPRGEYGLGCRVVHPITGELLGEDLNRFVIQ